MKSSLRMLSTALLLGGAPILTSCTDHISTDSSAAASYSPGVPGGKVTQTVEVNATVTGIDSASRKVTLVSRAGEKFAVTAGPAVANFNQIRVGDQLKVTFTEELLVRMSKPGESTEDKASTSAEVAPLGAKPGASASASLQMTATVTEIDTERRKVKLQFSDGSTRKFPVREDIDLSKHKVGETYIIRVTEAIAARMQKA